MGDDGGDDGGDDNDKEGGEDQEVSPPQIGANCVEIGRPKMASRNWKQTRGQMKACSGHGPGWMFGRLSQTLLKDIKSVLAPFRSIVTFNAFVCDA